LNDDAGVSWIWDSISTPRPPMEALLCGGPANDAVISYPESIGAPRTCKNDIIILKIGHLFETKLFCIALQNNEMKKAMSGGVVVPVHMENIQECSQEYCGSQFRFLKFRTFSPRLASGVYQNVLMLDYFLN
jgi:hypothetical protein